MSKDTNPAASSAPLELDGNLRLHPQRLNIGQAELLTDALRLPFTDIEARLAQYVIGSSTQESAQLRKSIKHYLGRLNANPLIPLAFRMKVLNRFEHDLNLFDGEMTAAVLNAHKIAVEMVQKAAKNDSSYYPVLVDMVTSAIELALKLMLISLEKYHAPAVIATRQFFELAKLGLAVAAQLEHRQHVKVERLHTAICKFELLRLLDFYSKTTKQQQLTWKELQYHIGSLQAQLLRSGEIYEPLNDCRFMVSNLFRPNDAANVVAEPPDPLEYDCILIPVDMLFSRVSIAIERVLSILNSQELQKDLHTEEAILTTLVGGKAILKALSHSERRNNRTDDSQSRFVIEWNAVRAFNTLSGAGKVRTGALNSALEQKNSWQILDISTHGACIEQLHTQHLTDYVGKLIGLNLQQKQGKAYACVAWTEAVENRAFKLGFVRWARHSRGGELRLGIEFLRGRLQLVQGMILASSENMDLNRSWPIIITAAGSDSHTALFPDNRIYRNMTFALVKGERKAHYIVKQILHKGENYSLCEIRRAKVKGRSET